MQSQPLREAAASERRRRTDAIVGVSATPVSGCGSRVLVYSYTEYRVFTDAFSFFVDYTYHMVLTPAPIVPSTACSNNLFILRDYEHVSALSPLVCGNKARKLASLIEALPTKSKSPLVSHGGGQSNAMLALARVCHASSTPFTYHTRPLPRWLRSKPIGNLAKALALGMCLVEHKTAVAYEAACADLRSQPNFVPQGAAYPGAELGVAGLATEIDDWWGATRRPRAQHAYRAEHPGNNSHLAT